jgi:hypothetical protein
MWSQKMTSVRLVTGPAVEPVALADLKTYLRIDGTADDALLTSLIVAARVQLEQWLNRKLITQTWDYRLDDLPAVREFDALLSNGVQEGALSEYLKTRNVIHLPFFPLQSVTYLKTIDDAGTEFTMDPTEYIVDEFSEPGRVSLKNTTTWPATFLRPVKSVLIRFVCGYGASASTVPVALTQAIMEQAAYLYQNRGGCADGHELGVSPMVLALIGPYRILRVG